MSHTLSEVPLRTARWCATHPWRAIAAWVAFVVLACGLAWSIPAQDTTDADSRIGDSGRADAMTTAAGLDAPPTESILITARSGHLDQATASSAADAVRVAMTPLPGVKSVSATQTSPDGSAMLLSVRLARDQKDADRLVAATAAVQHRFPDLRVREAGDLSVDAAIDDRVAHDLGSAEGGSLPVTLVLMLVAFGALTAAGIPVLLAATSVAAAIGITAPLSHLVHSDSTVTSMVVLIGMAVGVDYTLFYLKRQREELASGHSTLDAVEIAARTSGHSILVSGGAVMASMAGLFLVGDATFRSLAVGAISVVGIAVLGSITVLPALLVKLGRWVDRPRVPLLWRFNRRIGRGGLSSRILGPVVAHPAVALGLSVVVVLLLAVPALGMRTHSGDLQTLPASIPQVQTLRDVTEEFPSEGASADVVVRAAAGDPARVASALADLRTSAAGSGLFEKDAAPVDVSADGRTWVLSLTMPYDDSDPRVDKAIRLLRSDLVPTALASTHASYAVGGDPAESLDFVQREQSRLPWVIGFVLLLVMLIMCGTFRSAPIAILSAILDLASVGVAFGLMTLVFQHGWFESALDFTSPGFVIDWLPLFVLVVLVGLSMDYHVFVLSRVREHLDRGLPARLAVRQGVSDTAGVVTSAAAVMVSVFAIFATLSMMEMKMMGVALSGAILLDATLVRLVMLPAALCLLGDRAWPRRRSASSELRSDVSGAPGASAPPPRSGPRLRQRAPRLLG